MKRLVIFGVLLFLTFTVAFAPAGIVTRLIPSSATTLLEPEGSLWHGQAKLYHQGHGLGTLSWRLHPTSLLLLNPRVDWRLTQRGLTASATTIGVTTPNFVVNGDLDMHLIAPLLARYDLSVPGTVTFNGVSGRLDPQERTLTELAGQALWSGGPIEYVLSGQRSKSVLPAMEVILNAPASATVRALGARVPMMEIAFTAQGSVAIGLTKMFTKLLGRSWPGRDPDHTIVLVVEEQFF